MRLRLLASCVGLFSASLWIAACSDPDDKKVDGAAGAAGEAPTSNGSGGGCSEDGKGTLVVKVTGLPDGVDPDITLKGSKTYDVTDASTLEDVPAGSYTVTARRVFDADPIVRTVFDPNIGTEEFCVSDGDSLSIEVEYKAIPSSNKLWMPTALDEEGAGFSSEVLAESATVPASVSIDGGIGKAVAFDRDGNLWTLGPTLDFPHVLRFPAASLGSSGAREPDVSFNLPEVECIPAMRNLALDASGNLWLSVCGDRVLRIASADLKGVGGDKVADVEIAGATDADGLAFDRQGNLWVAGTNILRYDAARLTDSIEGDADLIATAMDETADLKASNLTFDKAGNLWGTDFGANAVFQLAAADLDATGSKDLTVNVSITIGVLGLLNQSAFDDGNNLWLGLDAGHFGMLSAEQLGESAGPGSPVTPKIVIKSKSIDSLLPVAFFPAPQGLPLYHSIPAE